MTAAGAGAGLYLSGLFKEAGLYSRPSLAPVVVGAALGAIWGGFSVAIARAPRPRSPLPRVYKYLCRDCYRVVKRYKSHHTAQVVLALTRGNNKPVILKLPKPTMDAGAISSKSREIWREYQIVSEIKSPHVAEAIDYYEGGDRDESYYIAVFEYIPGPTLKEVVEKGPLTIAQLKEIFSDLAKGLGDVHRAGYDHADIKPENVILHPERGAVLIDFQHALQRDHFGGILTDWCYLLYEAITGKEGHFGPEDTVKDLLGKRIALNSSEIKDAEVLQKIVDRAMQKPGVEPYSNFDAFLEELDRWENL